MIVVLSAAGYTGRCVVVALVARGLPVRGMVRDPAAVPLAEYAPAAALLTNPYAADGFRRLREHYDRYGFHGGNALVLRSILGREPRGFADAWRGLSEG